MFLFFPVPFFYPVPVQTAPEPGNPWSGPAILAGLLAAAGIILTLIRDFWQRRIKLKVKAVRLFRHAGIGDMEVFITNDGYRPFTLIGAAVAVSGNAPTPVYTEMRLLPPGDSVHFVVKDFMAWIYSEYLVVDVAPGKRVWHRLPHQSKRIERERDKITKEIERTALPYRFFTNQGGTWFGDGTVGVMVQPAFLAVSANDEIGPSTCSVSNADSDTKIAAIINHLADNNPKLFMKTSRWGDEMPVLLWKKDVIARFR